MRANLYDMASSYDIAITAEGRKTPLLTHTGTVPRVGDLRVVRDAGRVLLVYGPDDSAPVVLAEAKDPGGELTLVRQGSDGKRVTRLVG